MVSKDVTDLETAGTIHSQTPVAFDARPSYYQFTLAEIEAATNNFADKNVVVCGDYAIVYHAITFGSTRVAVKRLLSSRLVHGQFSIDLSYIHR